MKTLQIDEKNARIFYPSADAAFKASLEDTFGKDFFSQKIADRVQNFDDILNISGKTIADLVSPHDTEDEIAYKYAKLIAQVYNEGTALNAKDQNQWKYFPWHKIEEDPSKPSGFGLSSVAFGVWDSCSDVGVRLCFARKEDAIDAGKKFIEIYENLKIR